MIPSRPARGELEAEAAALLRRPDDSAHSDAVRALVDGRTALVTGGGGSIGSELVRQLHALGAGKVFVLDHDEESLHAIALELAGDGLLVGDEPVLADVRDRGTMLRTVAELAPDLVFHAAAHKHLPLLERFPAEAVKTNVLGTANVVEASRAAGVERFVNVSTDKAVRPTSVLGITKRVAEILVAESGGDATKVASVRFGNVLGSSGSFLSTLRWQIHNGSEVTITDPDVTRFFMTTQEAGGLVLEAAVMASEGETYVLDMGDQVRIVDIVTRYAELIGVPAPAVRFTGLRPGEKLHEELFDRYDGQLPTAHPRISRTTGGQAVGRVWGDELDAIRALLADGDAEAVMDLVRSHLPRIELDEATAPV